MFEEFGTACNSFQNLAADLVQRLQSQTPCTELGPFNYIMFDQSGGKGRILLHPTSLVRALPAGSSSPPRLGTPDMSEEGSVQDELKDTLPGTSPQAEWDPRMSTNTETVPSAYVALQPKQSSREQPRNHILTASFPEVFDAYREGEVEFSQAEGGYLHEDADDLAALLGCSDEDGSVTGNAASSELTCHFGLDQEIVEACIPSSRKRVHEEADEEVDSRFNKRQRSQEELDDEVDDICNGTCSSSMSVVDTFIGDSLGSSSPEDDCKEDCQDIDESALELQMLCDDFAFEMPEEQQCSSCSKEDGEEGDTVSSGSARKSRRDKIKKTVRLLRNIIPGGNCMDTAIVLDEAIHYVKLLQLQVQTLEAKRLVERGR